MADGVRKKVKNHRSVSVAREGDCIVIYCPAVAALTLPESHTLLFRLYQAIREAENARDREAIANAAELT